MSNAKYLLDVLNRKCTKLHQHSPLLGGGRAAAAAVYPPALVEAILKEAQKRLEMDNLVNKAVLSAVAPAAVPAASALRQPLASCSARLGDRAASACRGRLGLRARRICHPGPPGSERDTHKPHPDPRL